MRLDRPGGAPRQVAPLPKPGGLLLEPGGTVIAGSGNGFQEGAIGQREPDGEAAADRSAHRPHDDLRDGPADGQRPGARPRRHDLRLRRRRTPGHRPLPQRQGRDPWAEVPSANGLAVDRAGRYLYANQTFVPAAIARVDLRDPSKVETFARPGPEDVSAGARRDDDRPVRPPVLRRQRRRAAVADRHRPLDLRARARPAAAERRGVRRRRRVPRHQPLRGHVLRATWSRSRARGPCRRPPRCRAPACGCGVSPRRVRARAGVRGSAAGVASCAAARSPPRRGPASASAGGWCGMNRRGRRDARPPLPQAAAACA